MNHGNNPGARLPLWFAKRQLNRIDIRLSAWLIVDSASGGQHVLILILGFLALIEFGTRPDHSLPASLASATSATHEYPDSSTKTNKRQDSRDREQWLLPSIALGSLIYSLHERLSDPSSLVAWSWSGFPISGPHPHVHAPLTILAQVLAILLALALSPLNSTSAPPRPRTGFPNITSHPLVFVIGLISTYLLHTRTGWVGYIGGLLHTVFLTFITPPLLQNAGFAARACGAGRVFGTAWAVWIVFLFVGTFTVAYAFVPGAWSFRERTDL
jgi:hypothetical protein